MPYIGDSKFSARNIVVVVFLIFFYSFNCCSNWNINHEVIDFLGIFFEEFIMC